jgi:release factor glutamine methyltransferase
VLDYLRITTEHLVKKGFDSPRLETEYLLSHVLGVDRVGLYLEYDRPLSSQEIGRFRSVLRRRLNHEPLQWILGNTEFYGLKLTQRSGVFIPRPETEVLVEVTCDLISKMVMCCQVGTPDSTSVGQLRLLDIGTGSGAIALALAVEISKWCQVREPDTTQTVGTPDTTQKVAAELPEIVVHGCDISPVALELARKNGENLKLNDRVQFDFWDVMDFKIPTLFENPYHWIVMNPPYVPSGDWEKLPPDVKAEPKAALDGGDDGLDFYRRLVELLPDILLKGGGISVEVGIGQADIVVEIISGLFQEVNKKADLAGIDRVVWGVGFKTAG